MRKMILFLVLVLILVSGCATKMEPIIKQPDKPNVLKYVTDEEIANVKYKVAPNILENGVPDYAVKNNDTVEISVVFYDNVSFNQAKEIAAKYGNILEGDDSGFYSFSHQFIMNIPQSLFWLLVDEGEVKRVREGNPPTQDLAG